MLKNEKKREECFNKGQNAIEKVSMLLGKMGAQKFLIVCATSSLRDDGKLCLGVIHILRRQNFRIF